MIRIWCPRCSQGWVYRKRAPGASAFWVCEECEGVWFGGQVVPVPEGDLTTSLELIDSPARYWKDLEDSTSSYDSAPASPRSARHETATNLRIWCPGCGQGWVHRKRAEGVAPFWVCDECESVWLTSDIGPEPETALEPYLEQRGSSARCWNDLEDPTDDPSDLM